MRAKPLLIALGLLLGGAVQAWSAAPARPPEDVARDAARKPAQMVAFAGIKPGDKVGDLIPGGGYFTRVFAGAVGPSGKVYALIPARSEELHPEWSAAVRQIAASPGYDNVQVEVFAAGHALPEPLDVVWTAQNYHDVHNIPDPAAVAGPTRRCSRC